MDKLIYIRVESDNENDINSFKKYYSRSLYCKRIIYNNNSLEIIMKTNNIARATQYISISGFNDIKKIIILKRFIPISLQLFILKKLKKHKII